MGNDQADIGLIGLAVMGQNLALNMSDHGYKVAVFNRTTSKVDEFIGANKEAKLVPARAVEELVSSLKTPRKVMLMVKAGEAVDQMIDQLAPHLSAGDIIIDGGNSNFEDTNRRLDRLKQKGILFVGAGISGGEEGARHGPAIMPGGSSEAWEQHIMDIFLAIAAKGIDGLPCCDWVGEGGSGHFVKMVHNGIEYADMQLIAESYQLLKNLVGLSNDEAAKVFNEWNQKELKSYLIEITAEILAYKDGDGQPLIDKILDTAEQKGTGKWTVISASNLGQPTTVIAEALFARFTSALKSERETASKFLSAPEAKATPDKSAFTSDLFSALYASKIIAYAQGYMLMSHASKEYNWNLNLAAIAQIWSGGSIVRSQFLKNIKNEYLAQPKLDNLLTQEFFAKSLANAQESWRRVITTAISSGLPLPAMSSALAFYDSYRSEKLPANLIQAQRDYFGAHTYERTDKAKGEYFHTDWAIPKDKS